ncbi:hypothetical protein ADUPG1_005787, partial [Aduncisulcus paluster]
RDLEIQHKQAAMRRQEDDMRLTLETKSNLVLDVVRSRESIISKMSIPNSIGSQAAPQPSSEIIPPRSTNLVDSSIPSEVVSLAFVSSDALKISESTKVPAIG